MSPDVTLLLFFTLLTITIPAKSQFEFNDIQTIHDAIIDLMQFQSINCVKILRPIFESPSQKSAIDRLTRGLAKNYDSRYGDRIKTVMSYSSKSYKESQMNLNERDGCIYWATIVMVTNSTNEQLSQVSRL